VVAPTVDLISLPTTTTSLSVNSFFQVRIGAINATNNGIGVEEVIRAGGTGVRATVTNSNATVAQLVTRDSTRQTISVDIPVGQSRSPGSMPTGGVSFDPQANGSTTVSTSIPGFTAVPGSSASVTVNAPAISIGSINRVGNGLQVASSASLGATNYGTTTVRVSSTDPTRALISPNANTPGTAFVDFPLTAPVQSLGFYVQGVGSDTGLVTITATAPSFTDGSSDVDVVPPALDIISLPSTTTAGAANTNFQIRLGAISAGNNSVGVEEVIRAGGSDATISITNSNAAAAQLVAGVTGQAVTVSIPVGQSRSAGTVATGGVAFDPLAVGTTTVSASSTGYSTVPNSSETVTVNP
jgi:hypothetical protein